MSVIQSRKKFKVAVCLMLIFQNGVFADFSCKYGIKVGGADGYNGVSIPTDFNCKTGKTCLRAEVDEMTNPDGDTMQNVVAMDCMDPNLCAKYYEDADEATINSWTALRVGDFLSQANEYNPGKKGARAVCCESDNCNSKAIDRAIPDPSDPEMSAGSKFAAPLNLLAAVVVLIFC